MKSILVILTILLSFIACSPKSNFDLNSIKGQISEKLPENKIEELRAMKKESVINLKPEDKKSVAEIVYDQLQNRTDLMKLGKLTCHLMIGLPAGDECVQKRDECLEELKNAKESGLKDAVKDHKDTILAYISGMKAQPEFFIAAFDTLNFGLNAAAKIDCGSSEAEQLAIFDDVRKKVSASYGEEAVTPIENLINELLSLAAETSIE